MKKFIGEAAFGETALPSITLRSTIDVEQDAFGQDVTIFTDAESAPENWEFLDGHFVFWECVLAESRNYVEYIIGVSNMAYEGAINAPYKQGTFGCEWSTNEITVLYDYHEEDLVPYTLEHIMSDNDYMGAQIKALYGSVYF